MNDEYDNAVKLYLHICKKEKNTEHIWVSVQGQTLVLVFQFPKDINIRQQIALEEIKDNTSHAITALADRLLEDVNITYSSICKNIRRK